MNSIRVFVVSAYENRKYKYDEERYELFPAVWWNDLQDKDVEGYYLRYNAKMELRKKVVACSMSHKNLLQKIINEDLKQVVIIEDDAVIENNQWKRLEELKDVNEFCYIGGYISSPFLKDLKTFEENDKEDIRHDLIKGINTIDSKIFRIGQTCGYYIPNAEVARMILSNIPNGKKERAIDNEYMALQKKGNITKFIYPAIATLFIKEAKEGFTFSNHKLYDDQTFY
jgi:GR25 family glycosyltransferase involved in LPS biosynthesis